ncbi:hypothetical protein GRZ57_01925 [Sphaerochaeta halotolerans]|nr:hypothetical protein [Sphaerochaeta halotolerans]
MTNTFSDRLFFAGYERTGNRMISPLSALLALLMTMNGVVGQTESEMLSVLTDATDAILNKKSKIYLDSIQMENVLAISNSIWVNDAFDVSPVFLNTIEKYYQGDAQSLDLGDNSSAESITMPMLRKQPEGQLRLLSIAHPPTCSCISSIPLHSRMTGKNGLQAVIPEKQFSLVSIKRQPFLS